MIRIALPSIAMHHTGEIAALLASDGPQIAKVREKDIVSFNRDKGNKFVEATQSPEGAAAWKHQLDQYAPGASDWVVGAVFGGTYQREGLELRDRQMLNMAALAAMGGTEPQLTGHIKTAVDVAGMTREEVAECFVHLMPYIGIPKVLAAMRCMEAAFGE